MKAKTLYLECYTGISGDRIVAALLDAGADRKGLLKMLESASLKDLHVKIGSREVCGVEACTFEAGSEKKQAEECLERIFRKIENIEADEKVKRMAKRIFQRASETKERWVRNLGTEKSFVEILSAVYCLENLNVDHVVVSDVYEGHGQIQMAEGLFPIPVPAVAEIIKNSSLVLRLTEREEEMITVSGAAIAAALAEYGDGTGKQKGKLLAVGNGVGKQEIAGGGMLRAMIFEEGEEIEDRLWVLETNIDDSTGEALGYTTEKLMEAGAKDVSCTPIYMKKGRPATQLNVLTDESHRRKLEDLIFLHTSTIGIRRYEVKRRALERRLEICATSFGTVQVKTIWGVGERKRIPEYESVRKICEETGKGFWQVYDRVRREIGEE